MTDVPFRSLSNIQQAIKDFRKKFKTNPPVKRGKANTPSGEPYNYFLSEDLLDYVQKFLEKRKLYLDTETFITVSGGTGIRFTIIDYERTEGDTHKFSEISIGTPASVAELGARITYAQKYLISVLFGVSIATDTDAFNNGKTIEHDKQTVADNVADTVSNNDSANVESSSRDESVGVPHTEQPTGTDSTTSPERPVGVAVEKTGEVAHTKSYGLAKTFIEKALSNDMLDQAVTKINNSANMTEEEKKELLELVGSRRKEVTA